MIHARQIETPKAKKKAETPTPAPMRALGSARAAH
jgi:hypothetical protein